MRLYAYVIPYDNGFSPNPAHGFCTLACCKPRIRESVGKYVIESFEEQLIQGMPEIIRCKKIVKKDGKRREEDALIESKGDIDAFFGEDSGFSKEVQDKLQEKGLWDDGKSAWDCIKDGLKKKNRPSKTADIRREFKEAAFEAKGYSPVGTLSGVKAHYKQSEDFESFVSGLAIFVVGIKPKGEKTENDEQGDRIVYAMKVTDVLTFKEYWDDERFKAKRPEPGYFTEHKESDGSFSPDDCGDNVYEIETVGGGPRIVIHPSFHYFKGSDPVPQACKDLGGLYVLVSREGNFSYFGRKAHTWKGGKNIISEFHKGRAHSILHYPKSGEGQRELTPETIKKLEDLIKENPGIQAAPNGFTLSDCDTGEEWWGINRDADNQHETR